MDRNEGQDGAGTGFIRSQRLKNRKEFLFLAARGRKAPVSGLVLQLFRRQDSDAARVGFTVTKKVGNAVVRNRARRRLREVVRLVEADTPLNGLDLVLIGRAATGQRLFTDLVADFRKALKLCLAEADRKAHPHKK
ncbi:ribonuclease P protein component [Acetobacter indonesiensis]|uniref:Ribonuclease P protein component n=1 Tax=Acetobacter indonesiensis TaxID=104101 RepID=A0A252AYN8_9PROT|nr:ribonuclease P protein component [Acetobacter indonesiensis]MCG0993783.1 ribonuclease P protein component [Acetobacter indonesiensis]MCP1231233.1 ribonuclease P protein component [Acetobacter indonesiensis]OUI96506.1 ribonuclease P [Acetobacter indonesiensis]OUI96816.1 ribonuclease P [Acetobacter indonesiensis]